MAEPAKNSKPEPKSKPNLTAKAGQGEGGGKQRTEGSLKVVFNAPLDDGPSEAEQPLSGIDGGGESTPRDNNHLSEVPSGADEQPSGIARDDLAPASTGRERDNVGKGFDKNKVADSPTRDELEPGADGTENDDLEEPAKDDLQPDDEATENDNLDNTQRRPAGAPAEPVYDTAGNEGSDTTGKPLASDSGKSDTPSTDKLAKAEKGAGAVAPETKDDISGEAEKLGLEDGPENDSFYKKKPTFNKNIRVLRLSKKKKIFGGGIVGTIIGLFMFLTLSSGPLQFIHIAQLLQQFHLSSPASTQDNRVMHQLRWLRYKSSGNVQNARMGFLGNKLANTFEARLTKIGLIPRYSPTYGLFIGYELDTATKGSPYEGMTKKEAQLAAGSKYGVEISSYGETGDAARNKNILDKSLVGKPMIEVPKGYAQSLKTNQSIFQKAGLSNVAASVAAKLSANRAGASLHPLNVLKTKLQAKAEGKVAAKADIEKEVNANQDKLVRKGFTYRVVTAVSDKLFGNPTKDSTAAQTEGALANSARAATDDILATGVATSGELASGTTTSVDAVKSKFSLGGSLKGFAKSQVLGLACTLRTIDERAPLIKQAQVVLPLIRMSTEAIALGGQIKSGKGADMDQLNVLSKQFSGIDSNGNKTNWFQAESIQAELGKTKTGVAPDDTLKNITNDRSPFHFINNGDALGASVGSVCHGVVGTLVGVFSFFGGGKLVDFVVGPVISIVENRIATIAARWIAGAAVSAAVVGADYGNYVNYGAKLAANDQSLTNGGAKLDTAEAQAMRDIQNTQWQDDYKSKSIAYKLFNTHDSRSAISHLVDQTSPSLSQNVASLGHSLLNIGHSFGSIAQIFSPPVKAASAGYGYDGIPTIGFSQAELDTQEFDNPYQNSADVATLLSSSEGPGLINKAKRCFGLNIYKNMTDVTNTPEGQWDVTSLGQSDIPIYSDIADDCKGSANQSDTEGFKWLKVRFFILDTVTMNSMACYDGEDNACNNLGYSSSTAQNNASPNSGGGSTATPMPTVPAGTQIVGNIGNNSDSVACATGTNDLGTVTTKYTGEYKLETGPLIIRLCQIPDIPGQGNNPQGVEINGGAVVNSRVSGAWLALGKAAKTAQVSLFADSSFRLADSCNGTGTGGRCATPGDSPHQMGVAIDFGNMNGIDETKQTCSVRETDLLSKQWQWMYKNAELFGFQQYSAESWHWDPIPMSNRCNSSEPVGLVP